MGWRTADRITWEGWPTSIKWLCVCVCACLHMLAESWVLCGIEEAISFALGILSLEPRPPEAAHLSMVTQPLKEESPFWRFSSTKPFIARGRNRIPSKIKVSALHVGLHEIGTQPSTRGVDLLVEEFRVFNEWTTGTTTFYVTRRLKGQENEKNILYDELPDHTISQRSDPQ